jgi:4,5-DOPA dioxygenase extradiol
MTNKRMPALFVGHGSPMNAIEENQFVQGWKEITHTFDKPKAILVISAHWVTQGTHINDAIKPRQIYDMYGFPEALYKLVYDVSGSPELAHSTIKLLNRDVAIDNSWGIDHGTWSVLCKMYPEADIPVLQLSIDRNASAETHYQIGKQLRSLRDEGILILGSGNVVHNLSKINWDMDGGYAWAEEFDNYILTNIKNRNYDNVMNYRLVGKASDLAFYTTEHFYPLLYVLGASLDEDTVTVFNQSCLMGSMSMTGYLFN